MPHDRPLVACMHEDAVVALRERHAMVGIGLRQQYLLNDALCVKTLVEGGKGQLVLFERQEVDHQLTDECQHALHLQTVGPRLQLHKIDTVARLAQQDAQMEQVGQGDALAEQVLRQTEQQVEQGEGGGQRLQLLIAKEDGVGATLAQLLFEHALETVSQQTVAQLQQPMMMHDAGTQPFIGCGVLVVETQVAAGVVSPVVGLFALCLVGEEDVDARCVTMGCHRVVDGIGQGTSEDGAALLQGQSFVQLQGYGNSLGIGLLCRLCPILHDGDKSLGHLQEELVATAPIAVVDEGCGVVESRQLDHLPPFPCGHGLDGLVGAKAAGAQQSQVVPGDDAIQSLMLNNLGV